ncbi:MAG: polysaccharide biosynthesis/export family protein, partial [Candidatus Margulisiibacteriota bacterium]|nr:polysaccharide biosynthesis/export family protein [Candidatus Margulisiibacteriota bacterium]
MFRIICSTLIGITMQLVGFPTSAMLQNVNVQNLSPQQKQIAMEYLSIQNTPSNQNVIDQGALIASTGNIGATLNAVVPEAPLSLIEKEYNAVDIVHYIPTLANEFVKINRIIEDDTSSENASESAVLDSPEVTKNKKDEVPPLRQYGYNFFNHYSYYFPTNQTSVPSGYQLQKGDKVTLIIYGKKEQVMDLVLDNQGDVILPNIGPVNLSGLTVGEANKKLAIQLRKKFVNFES